MGLNFTYVLTSTDITTDKFAITSPTTIRCSTPTCFSIASIVIPVVWQTVRKILGRWIIGLAERLAGLPIVNFVTETVVNVAARLTVIIYAMLNAAAR